MLDDSWGSETRRRSLRDHPENEFGLAPHRIRARTVRAYRGIKAMAGPKNFGSNRHVWSKYGVPFDRPLAEIRIRNGVARCQQEPPQNPRRRGGLPTQHQRTAQGNKRRTRIRSLPPP